MYKESFNLPIIIIALLAIAICFFISLFTLYEIFKLDRTLKCLEEEKLQNKSLKVIHDGIRIFKHDFSNIIQSFEGYIVNNDMNGLKKYFKGIKKECNDINNLEVLNSNLIPDPAIYYLIASKYNLAIKNNLSFNIDISTNFKNLNITPYKLTRILGILLDNAIEAANTSKEKKISLSVFGPLCSIDSKKYIISIENSYLDKNIDLNKICEKGYTSKNSDKTSHGIGLWELNKIIKKSNNLNLHTTKNEKLFIQELEIYEN